MPRNSSRPVLDQDHAAFIQGPVSIIVCSRNEALVPDVVRALACRVSRDRRRITVLVESDRARAALDDIVENGHVAVVFSQPSTHRTIQVKGRDATLAPVPRPARGWIAHHLRSWSEDLMAIGHSAEFARAVHGTGEGELSAIVFTAEAAFMQTPGPGAGSNLVR